MKKTILTSAILLTAFAGAFAQARTSVPATEILKSRDATLLQVVLKPIQTIEVADKPIVLTYATKNDYVNGVTSVEKNHLSIFSTGGFAVIVKAAGDLIGNQGNTIESEGISVRLGPATENAIPVLSTSTGVVLTDAPQRFFSSGKGGANKTFSVIYKGAGDSKFINNYKKDMDNTYETVVTYSIEAI